MKVDVKGVSEDSQFLFHTPSNISKLMFFYLSRAGHFYCNGDYYVKRDTANSYLVMYIKKGQGTVCFDNKTYDAKANEVVFLNCHKPHIYFTTSGWETLWFHFDGNTSQHFFNLIYAQLGCVIPASNSHIIPKYINIILNQFSNSGCIQEPLISCHIQRILTEMLLISSSSSVQKLDKINPVQEALAYIGANFKTKLSLKELACYCNISLYHFSRIFKKQTGYSPYEYILKTRIDHAKILLMKTNRSIKEITFEVGFNSESNFVTTFHSSVKMTPSQFRSIPL